MKGGTGSFEDLWGINELIAKNRPDTVNAAPEQEVTDSDNKQSGSAIGDYLRKTQLYKRLRAFKAEGNDSCSAERESGRRMAYTKLACFEGELSRIAVSGGHSERSRSDC